MLLLPLLLPALLRIPCTDLLDPPAGPMSAPAAASVDIPTEDALLRPAAAGEPALRRVPRDGLAICGADEHATYVVRYGFLGQVGELRLSTTPVSFAANEANAVPVLRIVGEGSGDVLGFGRFERTIETELDLDRWASRRWRSVRHTVGLASEETVTDSVIRQPGDRLAIERRKGTATTPTSAETLMQASTTSDPLGVIWRLRNRPPATGESQILQMLDGMALWRLEVRAAGANLVVPETSARGMELEAQMTPIFYNGQRDPGRPERHFRLWLEAGPGHMPLRLEMPIGVADAVLTLRETHRGGSATGSH